MAMAFFFLLCVLELVLALVPRDGIFLSWLAKAYCIGGGLIDLDSITGSPSGKKMEEMKGRKGGNKYSFNVCPVRARVCVLCRIYPFHALYCLFF